MQVVKSFKLTDDELHLYRKYGEAHYILGIVLAQLTKCLKLSLKQ